MRSFMLLPLLTLALIGCDSVGATASKNPDPVEISGKVSLAGKPVSNVVLNLQPTESGAQATADVKDGIFKATVTPGKYTYFLSEGKVAQAFASIPEKFRAGAMDRQIDIAAGTSLDLKLE